MNGVIQKAITLAGSQKELARKVGVDQSAVSKWLNGGGIRSQYIPAIVAATNDQLTAAEILASLQEQSPGDLSGNHLTAPAA
ncbi:helix-turn-helix domain-containing protein [Serratia fonticola]|jgi:DNA-binding transcriptional regulator YdaS (Cro superfamily)|uniref:transcriptional regulator n=1 Tax=Serratia TaxID=613 RepID=UPI001575C60A|nr:YdaS family helix-turn-helix protein [Serratia fonticola]NTY85535.1 helix-turn-helix domain-containing protein [Serratia fonticola]NTZ11622.1 helix-turn-helix domain-containing protein [Serratia fonticola]